MLQISFTPSMSITDVITSVGVVIAMFTLINAVRRYRHDHRQQLAAQTREDLQAIIGDCALFLRPLSQSHPYPIFHTVTAITKEFCSSMGASPRPENVQRLLSNKDLLRSICVDGWISSTQILHMMDIVEKLERKASSRNLQGKLLLIREASFLLASIVAEICSPESFYNMLCQLDLQSSCEDEVADILNAITVKLQHGICKTFNDKYKDKIERSLYFIQTAANMFIGLSDRQLRHLAGTPEVQGSHSTETDLDQEIEDPIVKIKKEGSPLSHYKAVSGFWMILNRI